jgi:hypothetical protein
MSDETLAFAEAMAMDPSEVEFCYEPGPTGANWSPLAAGMDQSLHGMRHARFRRALPRRSRVEEMAGVGETHIGIDTGKRAEFAGRVVNAVCEFLRKEKIGVRAAIGPCGPESAWAAIEREFLEPR